MNESTKKALVIAAAVVVIALGGFLVVRTMAQPQETIDTTYMQKARPVAPGVPATPASPAAPAMNPAKM